MFSDSEIGAQVGQLCAESGKIELDMMPHGAPPGELLKAQGPLKHGLVLRELTKAQRGFWTDKFAVNPPVKESYLVPLLATFSFSGNRWGVEPNQYLEDQTGKSECYDMKDLRHATTKHGTTLFRDYPSGISISQEHWEKMVIRLVEDVDNLRKVGAVGYKMSVTVYAEPQGEGARNSQGKRVVRAQGGSKPLGGLLLNGVTDYLQEGDDHAEANLYACRFFLNAATKMFTPCQWPRGAKSPTPCTMEGRTSTR